MDNLGIGEDLLILRTIIKEKELLIEEMKISIYLMTALIQIKLNTMPGEKKMLNTWILPSGIMMPQKAFQWHLGLPIMVIQLILRITNSQEDILHRKTILKINQLMIMSGEKRIYVSLILINGCLIHQKVILSDHITHGNMVDQQTLQPTPKVSETRIQDDYKIFKFCL